MTSRYRYYTISILLAITVLVETLCYTYVQQEGAFYYYSSSVVYFLSGIAVCLLPLFYKKTPNEFTGLVSGWTKFAGPVFILFIAILALYHIISLSALYKVFPVDKHLADMIPTMQIACKRILHGQKVYAPVPEINPTAVVPYFPLMWGAFLPSEIFGFDPRWTTVAALFAGIFLIALRFAKPRLHIPLLPLIISGVSLFLLLNFFLVHYHNFWGLTEEALVAGYYLFLGFCLLRKNYWLTGIALACCVLSRYSLAFWIPVYFGYVFLTQKRSDFFKLLIAFGALVLGLFIIPFFAADPAYFLKAQSKYESSFGWFWTEFHLVQNTYYSVGLYKFFTIDQIPLMMKLYTTTSFLAPLVFLLVGYRLQKKYGSDERYLAIGSLQINLVFFYNFFPGAYFYLFFPLTILSYAALFDFLARPTGDEVAIAQKRLKFKPEVNAPN
jgi:hypothetical protein